MNQKTHYHCKKEQVFQNCEICEEQVVLWTQAQAFPHFIQVVTDVIAINVDSATCRGKQACQQVTHI